MMKRGNTLESNCPHPEKFRDGYCLDCYPFKYGRTWVDKDRGVIMVERTYKENDDKKHREGGMNKDYEN